MRIKWMPALLCLPLAAMLYPAAAAQVVLQTRNLRLEIGADGTLESLSDRSSGSEYAWLDEPGPIAMVYRGGRASVARQEDYVEDAAPLYHGGESFPASAAALEGDRLTIRFREANAAATYRVTARPDYLAFELLSLEGEPVDRIDLLLLRVKRLPFLGPWINVAYDDRFGICLCGGNLETNAGMNRHERYVEMRAIAQKDVAFQGATAVLFGFRDPRQRFLGVMEEVERDFDLPAGARHRRSPLQGYSYLWCSPTPENVDEYIKLAKRCGLRMIFYSYRSFTRGAGHFTFNAQFPGEMADLKRVADAIRAAGLKLGLHIHYSKAEKTDPYVTPVPDDRFHKVRTFTLAAAVDERGGTIPVRENPEGCTRDDGRRILKLGKELIAYRDYTTRPPWQFTGCERGHLNTTASAHGPGERVGLLNVDDWQIFIRFDQDTDIQDEVARRIGEIFRRTGPYDMVYFDGAEDVHAPFWYHTAGAQYRVFRHFDPVPPVCEAALNSHFGWHMMTRSNAYDVPAKHIKSFTHLVSCRTAPVRAMDFTRIEFGWVFGLYRDLGPDELEYLVSRAAAWDCPFSIRMNLAQVAANLRADDCFEVIKTWEDARLEGKITDAQREMLKTLDPKQHQLVKVWDAVKSGAWTDTWQNTPFTDQEHHLFINEQGEHELVAIDPIPNVAGGRCKAYRFRRAAEPDTTYVLLWATGPDVELRLPLAADRLTLMRPFGTRLPVSEERGIAIVPVGSRRYLALPGMDADQARDVFRPPTPRQP